MDVIKTFGSVISEQVQKNPDRARKILLAGYRAKNVGDRLHPDRKLPPSKQYIERLVMQEIIAALAHPKRTAMVSLFVPCEPLHAAGVTPYSVEAMSSYLAGTQCEKVFLDKTAEEGMPETMCSFHRTFIGAADTGLMPAPPFVIYTNLACDGNLITFPYVKQKYGIPGFFIDVPYEKNEEAVQHVAEQLKEMRSFVEDQTGRKITEEALQEAVGRSAATADNYRKYLHYTKTKYLQGTLTSEMYAVFIGHILLGTPEALRYSEMLLQDIRRAPDREKQLRILWLHLIPFMQPPVRDLFNYSDRAYVTASDLVYDGFPKQDPQHPFESMARRMVYSGFNGSPEGRIHRAIQAAEWTGADGAVVFAHWGCKSTIGAAGLLKEALENASVPSMILDGDGCNPANASDGQTATRLEAFLEMLEKKE